jgi:hypothetical protein
LQTIENPSLNTGSRFCSGKSFGAKSAYWPDVHQEEMTMRAGFLVLTLAIFSGGAWATDWTLLRDDAKTGEKTYVDKSSIAPMGTLARMWILINYKRPKGVAGRKHLSEKALVEYDCKRHESRKIEFSWYSRHDGEGELVYKYADLGTFLPAIPNSAAENAGRIACEKK